MGGSFYKHRVDARGFVERAQAHLAQFDEGAAASLFYAALELRFGIEARLYEYIDSTCRTQKLPADKDKDYVATKLLRKLISMEPDAESEVRLSIINEQTGQVSGLRFTPVTPKLAKMHGQIGEMLHAKFFRNNRYWYLKESASQQSLGFYRAFLQQVLEELLEATSGALLSVPRFREFVTEVLEEEDEASSGT